MNVQEYYSPKVLGVDATYNSAAEATAVGRFFAQTAGTITITKSDGSAVLTAFPVTAGQQVALHLRLGYGFVFTTGGGASGTLGIGN